MNKGKCIVLSAPSGSGKTTLAKRLLKNDSLSLAFSVSATSRKPRSHEQEGKDYFFLSSLAFQEKILKNDFIEYEEVYPTIFYGTLRSEVERLWKLGKHVIFDIDVEGGVNIKKLFPKQTITIFIQPPSLEALKERLIKRKTESKKSLEMRLSKAEKEMMLATKFDHIVENDTLEDADVELQQLVSQFIVS